MSSHRSVHAGILALALAAIFAFPVNAAEPEIVITVKDGKFEPSEVPTPAGQKVKLIVRNQGKSSAEFESTDLHREKVVKPGAEIVVFVGPLSAGSYEFFDDLHPENRGHLVVK